MRFQKQFGKKRIELSETEKKLMRQEILRQTAEIDRKDELEFEAIVLYVLHVRFGFGAKRLKQFYDSAKPIIDDLMDHYEMGEEDKLWLCTEKLKDIGVDLEQWNSEASKKESDHNG